MSFRFLILFVAWLVSSYGHGEEMDLDILMSGFSEDGPEASKSSFESTKHKPWSLDGYLDFELVWNTETPDAEGGDFSGLSHTRAHFKPELSYRRDRGDEFFISLDTYYDAIFLSKPSDDFTPEYVKDTRDQFELGKAYYQATLGSVDIKVGRQINIWGEAENVRVVDVINPIDSREIAMVDLESLRLPVGAAFASFYKGHWSLEAGVIWEFREDKMPVYGSDFSPLEQPPPPDEKPDPGEELGYTLAVRGILGGGDIGFYYADARHHQSVFDLEKRKMIYPEFEMMGASYARVSGSWVWRAELAYLEDVYEPGLSVANNRWDAMVGAEYYGSHNNTVTLEYAQRRYLDEESKQWGIRRKRDEIVCRYSQSFMREKLALNAFVLADSISDDSLLSRISITYKPADGWSTEFGGVIYQSDYSESYISVVDDNDRVYWRVRYDF